MLVGRSARRRGRHGAEDRRCVLGEVHVADPVNDGVEEPSPTAAAITTASALTWTGPHVVAAIGKADGRLHRVPVLPWLRPWLAAHLSTLPEGAVYLFPNPEGRRYGKSYDFGWAENVETGRERRAGALELAGVERRVRFHDLRGTCGTHLAIGTWGRSWSLHEIQRMLAHADQRVTERYVPRAPDALQDAAAATPDGPEGLGGRRGSGRR